MSSLSAARVVRRRRTDSSLLLWQPVAAEFLPAITPTVLKNVSTPVMCQKRRTGARQVVCIYVQQLALQHAISIDPEHVREGG